MPKMTDLSFGINVKDIYRLVLLYCTKFGKNYEKRRQRKGKYSFDITLNTLYFRRYNTRVDQSYVFPLGTCNKVKVMCFCCFMQTMTLT